MTKATSYHTDYPHSHSPITLKNNDGRYSGFWFGVDMTPATRPRKSSVPNVLRRKSSTIIEDDSTSPSNTPRKLRKSSTGNMKADELPSPSKAAFTSLLSKINQKRYYYTSEKPPQLDQLIQQQQSSFQPVEFSPSFTFEYRGASNSSPSQDRPSTPPTASQFSQTLYVPKVTKSAAQNPKHTSPDHPCLHEAYEKAVKTCSLTSPSLPAETILKHNAEVKAKENREKRGNMFSKSSKTKRLQIEWSKKMYVLVPGSSILQYSVDGSYDRVPERVLKLQAASLVFATDVVEGRHWVLQVNSNAEGVTPIGSVAPSNSSSSSNNSASSNASSRWPTLFGRLSTKTGKLDSSVFLLVFENAEEMQEWMNLIRQEIANLGGPSVEAPKVSSQHSRRLTKMSSFPTVASTSPTSSSHNNHAPPRSSHSNRGTNSRQSRDDTPSMSTVVSKDQTTLENLRRNGSFGSSRAPHRSTSPETSPERMSSSYTDTAHNTTQLINNNTHSKRRSLAASHRSRSSVDLKSVARSSRPPSTIYDQENWYPKHNRTPSPSLTQVSHSTCTVKKTREPLHSSVPIPVPTTRRGSKGGSSDNGRTNEEILRGSSSSRRPRTRRSTSHHASPPSTPKISIFPTIKSPTSPVGPLGLPPVASAITTNATPKKKARPVSLAAMPVSVRRQGTDDPTYMGSLGPSHFSSPAPRKPTKRRSMTTMSAPIGPPLHPPPSVPLPKLPTNASSYYDLNRNAATKTQTPPKVDRGRQRSGSETARRLNNRHSFHVMHAAQACN